MSRGIKLIPLLVLAIGCGTDSSDSTLAPQFAKTVQSVHGLIVIPGTGERSTFTAVLLPNGRVLGQFDVHSPTEGHIHGEVLCVTVEGNTARLAGVVESAPDLPGLEGLGASWTVVDNGEGAKDPEDLASDIRYGASLPVALAHCTVDRNLGFIRQDIGNIQVIID